MSAPLLEAEGLRRVFGGLVAVDNVDLTIRHGDLICIIGPNGAGKSTLFNMLCGSIRPSAGRIRFQGDDLTGMKPYRFARIGIARKFQVPGLFESMSVRDNLLVAARSLDPAAAASRAGELMDSLSLSTRSETPAGELPHGQKQWLEIGMGLMSAPKLLLLDEPTAGMSAEETRKTADLLLGLKGRIAVIAIEHDMRFVRQLACRTMVLHQGRLIADGTFAEIEANELVGDVYLGRR
ncbi:MAG: ABC transporter ATP-binding protein [Alphaproteobacteria bacterium]|nr:MAG: ABC transporter ATP-binding protein [Alphaproteobacteria bacterium]